MSYEPPKLGSSRIFGCQSQTDTLNFNRRFLGSHFTDLHEIWPLYCPHQVVRACLFLSKSAAPGSRDVLRSLRLTNSRLRPSQTFRPTVFWPSQSQDFRLQFLKAQRSGYRTSAVWPKSDGQIIFYFLLKFETAKTPANRRLTCSTSSEGFLAATSPICTNIGHPIAPTT